MVSAHVNAVMGRWERADGPVGPPWRRRAGGAFGHQSGGHHAVQRL